MAHVPLSSSLPNLESFCRTYETGSFTSAARALSVTPQAVSRSVSRLEGTLGVSLFRRTTRACAPTEAAHRYYTICRQALSLLSSGERELALGKKAPQGHVRISVPTTFGHHRLMPWLGAFRERYPEIRVDVNVSNLNIDFVRDGYDMAIRMGKVTDASLVARKLGDFALGVFGSPAYLARFGAPKTPKDLERHSCIGFLMPSTGRILPWTFSPSPRAFVPDATYRVSDDVLGVVTLATAGVGLVQIYDFLVESEVSRGALVEVLSNYRGGSRPFSLLYPRSVVPSRAARVLIDDIVDRAREARS
ncbi:Transcriptional regulator, LysR family [Labilithrix luteola]|uniref:Transcriptional regulator, LysR family n=1 Tax=Labilithrix luteola TaxID=1391654 RepID=A0A0K1PMC8_9BACT|nr:LysR family transcriptional regulator [Labilithrix luteola]AKU94693.1 Transcriptional regulator, LysR family [Labilithrix luteola]